MTWLSYHKEIIIEDNSCGNLQLFFAAPAPNFRLPIYDPDPSQLALGSWSGEGNNITPLYYNFVTISYRKIEWKSARKKIESKVGENLIFCEWYTIWNSPSVHVSITPTAKHKVSNFHIQFSVFMRDRKKS